MLTKEQLWNSRIDHVLQEKSQQVDSSKTDKIFKKAVIGIDRDGILIETRSMPIRTRREFKPIPGSLEAVALMRRKGYKVVIIFDQPEISKGLISVSEVESMNLYLLELLGTAGCPSIDGIFFCTSSDKTDMYSKHNDGMFKKAEKELKLSFRENGYYIGDSIEDLKIALKIKATPVLVKTGNYNNTIKQLNTFSNKKIQPKIKVFDSLMDFANNLN